MLITGVHQAESLLYNQWPRLTLDTLLPVHSPRHGPTQSVCVCGTGRTVYMFTLQSKSPSSSLTVTPAALNLQDWFLFQMCFLSVGFCLHPAVRPARYLQCITDCGNFSTSNLKKWLKRFKLSHVVFTSVARTVDLCMANFRA